MRSSSGGRAGGARRRAAAALLLCGALGAIAACSAASRGARPAGDAGRASEAAAPRPLVRAGDRADGLPAEAFDLLAKSLSDSCSACARDHRRHAFEILEESFPPGVVLRSDSLTRFTRAPEGGNELVIAPDAGADADARLSFRFHTPGDRLVGIADSDMTNDAIAATCRSAPAGARFDGAIEIVGFAYGDGATFLYHASRNRVEVQCRVLELTAK